MKLKEKDALLVTGPAHYEKALVDSVLRVINTNLIME